MTVSWRLEQQEIEEVEALAILIQETDSSILAFALYRSVAEREAAVQALKERLTLPVKEITLSAYQNNPVSLLYKFPTEKRVCIFFYDIEEALPNLAGYVNLGREKFAEAPHAVIFWVREHGMREIAIHAPDFWAWRSGVFDFRFEQSKLPIATVMQTVLAEPLVFHDRGDLERRVSLYQGLIREYSQQEKPDEHFLAGLQVKLGSAFYFLGHFEQAEACLREALERSQRVGNRQTEAIALHTLGILAQERSRLDEAEENYRRSLAIYEKFGDDVKLTASYHQLGTLAQERRQFDQAEQWYRKALEISERLGLERNTTAEYNQLGTIAQERRQFDQAEQWYRKALEISERLRLERDAAIGYHQLGVLAQERQQFDQAEQWYRKALEISERLELERNAAVEYHQLGRIAEERQKFDQAEQWYHKALKIFEHLKLERDAALVYNSLGVLAQKQLQFDQAEQRYQKALEIYKRLGLEQNAAGIAGIYHQLGILAQERRQFDQAEQWYREALKIFEYPKDSPLLAKTLAQLGILHRQRNQLHEAVSWLGRALEIAVKNGMLVGEQILIELAGIMKAIGEKEFTVTWRQAFKDREPPLTTIRNAMEKLERKTP